MTKKARSLGGHVCVNVRLAHWMHSDRRIEGKLEGNFESTKRCEYFIYPSVAVSLL